MEIKSLIFQTVTTAATMLTGSAPWWTGVPTKLLQKTLLVPARQATATLPSCLPVYTLTFEIPTNANSLGGKAINHQEIRLDLGDVIKMVIPGYKPKSYSVSALRKKQGEFDVTVKVYPNGRASGYLDRLQVGDCIHTFGMRRGGQRNPGSYVGVIAYGVGITEALPVARAELVKADAQKVVLLWASRTKADTFWNQEIEELEKDYPDQLEVVRIYSRETVCDQEEGILHGRITPQILKDVFQQAKNVADDARFLSVGTKEMMRLTDGMLEEIGFHMPQNALLPK